MPPQGWLFKSKSGNETNGFQGGTEDHNPQMSLAEPKIDLLLELGASFMNPFFKTALPKSSLCFKGCAVHESSRRNVQNQKTVLVRVKSRSLSMQRA